MAPPKDGRGDTLPSFSLWYKMKMAPRYLALRESQTKDSTRKLTRNLPHLTHNIAAFAIAVGSFRENKGRSWRRAAHIATVRYLLGKAQNASEIKFAFPLTTAGAYAKWAHKSGADVLTDELSEGAALHWIGPRREDRVLLYLHGTPLFSDSSK